MVTGPSPEEPHTTRRFSRWQRGMLKSVGRLVAPPGWVGRWTPLGARWLHRRTFPGATITTLPGEYKTESGVLLPEVNVAWEQFGDTSLPGSRTILLIPAFSAGSHARSSPGNPAPGWWENMIGPGCAIDTNRWRVICPALLGAPFGTTSAISLDPRTGKQYRLTFPQITIIDQVATHVRLLESLGVTELGAVIGSSVGGMNAIQLAADHPLMAKKLAAFCATAQTSPFTVALRRVQRQAILNDPQFHGGDYADFGVVPEAGLRLAREIGMLTYRSREEFDDRFEWSSVAGVRRFDQSTFAVESYLEKQGVDFSKRYDANCYLFMSRSSELMDISRKYGSYSAGLARIKAKTLLIATHQDVLVHHSEMRRIHEALPDSTFEVLDSFHGHDAFLTQPSFFGPRLWEFLNGSGV